MSNNKKTFVQKLHKGLHLFKRAYQKTKSQLGVSLIILLLVTIFLVLAMLLAETTNDNFSFWDALVWPLVKYVEDPADIAKPPLTVVGKFVGTLVGIMGVAIFAVPAGLIGSGLISAMEEQERERKLDKMRKRLHKSFRRSKATNLHEHIKKHKKEIELKKIKHLVVFTNERDPEKNPTIANIYNKVDALMKSKGVAPEMHVFLASSVQYDDSGVELKISDDLHEFTFKDESKTDTLILSRLHVLGENNRNHVVRVLEDRGFSVINPTIYFFPVPNVVPAFRTVGQLQVRNGMDMKDIVDTCQKFAEFRLQDKSRINSIDEMAGAPSYIVETFPLNRKYGCCIDRGSNVTILCTSSWDEVGMGHFCYYLAKFGGLNYISKEIEVDPDEPDSFYNYKEKPLYNKMCLEDFDKENEDYEEAREVLARKDESRRQFMADLKSLTEKGQWLVIVCESKKSEANPIHMHLVDRGKTGGTTVERQETYSNFCNQMAETMKEIDPQYLTTFSSNRYPFIVSAKDNPIVSKNIAYWIHGENNKCDCFAMRPASQVVNSSQRFLLAFRIALLISEMLDDGRGMTAEDREDFKPTTAKKTTKVFGYKDYFEPGESVDTLFPPKDLYD